VELERWRRAVAVKTFSDREDFLEDHFPGLPVVPGVLITEAMGQTGGWLLAESIARDERDERDERGWPLLTMIDRAKFRRLVRPGEELRMTATLSTRSKVDFEVRSEAHVDGDRVADARLLFHMFALPLRGEERARFDGWVRGVRREIQLG
jgi:3-hydroxyacyl-[acyl-carrier-protein] dehydratase